MNATFDEIILWRPNLFRLSRCSKSKTFISELATIYELVSVNECSLKYAVIFCQLILQRTTKSNPKKIKQTLSRRLALWHSRDFESLLFETRSLQALILNLNRPRPEMNRERIFKKMVFQWQTILSDEVSAGGPRLWIHLESHRCH
ncbi:hypothetical protein GJ496_000979 [Pomphorhynchus laevis]|nr:hypothetical protein GJ496_000979 [Pomphorhynchus laevis]